MSAVPTPSNVGLHAERGRMQEENDIEGGFTSQQTSSSETRNMYLQLYLASLNGDWDTAQGIYDQNQEAINSTITKRGETALHIAAAAEHNGFVENLIRIMSKEAIALQSKVGNTAFCFAAASGKVELAKIMLKNNKDLAMIRGRERMLPIYMAALSGHRRMVGYLYKETKDQLEEDDRINLLVTLINSDIYDVALDMVTKHPELATKRDKYDETALHAFARKPHMPSNISHPSPAGIWNRCINLFPGSKKVHQTKLMHKKALELIEFIWNQVVALDDSTISDLIGAPWRLIFLAAEQGNVEFLTILIRSYPELIFKVDDDTRSIFHIAVLYRHEDIFKLIHEIGSIKNLIATYKDKKGNNMLHLAGLLAPSNRLDVVPGAALQLQREILWFEEVKKDVQPRHIEAENNKGEKPGDLFRKRHKGLMKEGEKWMRDTATSCMVVATLIATVVFAAAFSVPGGNNQNSGIPIFLNRVPFKIFAVSDALSLICSASSVLTFLSILTSRYAERDFLWSLPNKLIIGLAMLFISVVAMLCAFIAAFFIVFQHRSLRYAVPIAAVASLPVILFIWQHYRLFVDVIKSTYRSRSLFRRNKVPLFSTRVNKKAAKFTSKEIKQL